MMKSPLRTILLLAVLVLCSGFPEPTPGKRVYDLAQVTSPDTQQELEAALRQIEEETTAQLAVVTVYSLGDKTIDEYATELFNNWGIGRQDVNNGVLFLVAPTERRVRIEVGYGLEPLLTDSLCGEILDTYVIPKFKENQIDAGIKAGVSEVIRILRTYPEAARGVPGSTPWYVSTPKNNAKYFSYLALGLSAFLLLLTVFSSWRNSFPSILFYLVVGLILAAIGVAFYWFFSVGSGSRPLKEPFGALIATLLSVFTGARKYRRYGPHNCKKCGTKLQLINEKQDDAKLTEVQKLEESLGSVDYDVWFCHSCLSTDTERYVSTFSGFKDCPSCKNRTYKETSSVAIPATRMSTGLRKYVGNCVSCKHAGTRTEVIPRITSSSSSGGSSSGGGSFGGGRSGGGGASRGW